MPLPFTRRGIDPDAADFCSRSGASDRAAVSAFVRGVKDLGLWESMVCWPLRSTQNTGTGTTAYSLGGLGTFNGSLINGPTWGSSGISFTATNRNIQLPDEPSLYNARSGMVAMQTTDTGLNRQLIEFQNGIDATGWYFLFRFQGIPEPSSAGFRLAMTRNGTSSGNDNAGRTINLVDFQTGAFTMNDSADNVFRNGSLEAGGARTGLSAINPAGARAIRLLFGNSTAMTGAFAMTSTATWTNSQVTALHNLYKQTLGTGLGLP
jgi:hypothetical protein